MDLIVLLIKVVINILKTMIPVFKVDIVTIEMFDNVFTTILLVFNQIDYFVSLNFIFTCLFLVFSARNWSFVTGIVKYIVGLIRG